jgi:hypothetical protein
VLLFDPPGSWKSSPLLHKSWWVPCGLAALAALAWYAVEWSLATVTPGGSSRPGLVFGTLGGVLMLYLFSYALRKTVLMRWWYSWRPTKYWLRQHIWFGLVTVPFVYVHAARITAWGPLHIALIVIYTIVILSGLWGVYLQQRIPTRLLQDVPDETIRWQIPDLTDQLRGEAELLVLATCGPPKHGPGAMELPLTLKNHIDVIRKAQHGKGTGLLAVLPREPVPDTEPLRRYFNETVEPYLRRDTTVRSKLQLRARVDKDFRDLRERLPIAAQPVIDALYDLCNRRRQFDEQAELHDRLHAWVGFHLVASALLVVLLICHVATAIYYW